MNAPRKRRSTIGRNSMSAEIIDLDDEEATTDEAPCLLVMEVPPSCDEELKNFHETLFGVMERKNIQPKMISINEVLAVQKSTPDIYVLPIFEGPEFDHLMDKGCKVIGPFVVDRCMKAETRLPKWRHAIYCLSMEGAVVCFSGLSKKKKTGLSDLVRRMGGQVSNDLHDKVTVLVSNSCDTDYAKYTESAKLKLPVLREDWITDAWKAVIDQLSDEPVTTSKVYDMYRVPLFKGMVISVSGLSKDERSNAGRLIEMGQGEFSPEMCKATCTHLITDRNSGEKFKKARAWGRVRIVTLKWLFKSYDVGYVQKESHYDPERVRASTPTKGGSKPPDELEFSMVAPAPPGPGGFNNTTISSGLNSSVNTTGRTLNDNSVVKASFSRHDSSRRMSTLMDSTMEEQRIVDATKDIEMGSMNGDEDFFEGLRIFLLGVPEVRESWWKKMLNWSGATRATRIEMATHVVVVGGGGIDKSILSSGKPVLTTEWVAACMKARKVMPHTDFLFSSTSTTSVLNQSLISSVNGPMKKTPAKASQMAKTRATSQQVLAAPSPSGSLSILHSNSLRRSTQVPPPSSSVGGRNIFKGVTFKMGDAIGPEESSDLLKMIKDGGGSVVSPLSSAHYLVCTLLDYGSVNSPLLHKTQDVVSVFWLYRCIDSCSLVSPSSHPLFRPLPACRGSSVFAGLVVSLIGFDYEQEMYAYEALLVQHGAKVCPQGGKVVPLGFTRTHTIAGGPPREGEWTGGGQTPLDPSWIIECIVHDKVLLEDKYLYKSHAYASYEGRKDDIWEWERCEERREERREGSREGAISRAQKNESTLLQESGTIDSDAILDMGAFDGEEEGEMMERSEAAIDEEDSMVREITEEMEIDGEREGERSRRDQLAPSVSSSSAVTSRTPGRGGSAATGILHHPRLQVLSSMATPSRRLIPTTSSPSQFLHPNALPKLYIPGAEEYLEEVSSTSYSEMDRSIDQLSASGVGRMLDGMVVTTGRMNSEMMETPVGGTSILEERDERDMNFLMQRRTTSGVRRNILEKERREEGEEEEDYGDEGEEEATDCATGDGGETMEVDEDSPRDSIITIPPDIEMKRREMLKAMKASLAASMKKEEEEKAASKTTTSSGTTTSGEKEKGSNDRKEGGGGGVMGTWRSRRKRLNLNDIKGTEAKRPAVVPIEEEEKKTPAPPPFIIGWADTPFERGDDDDDDANADHSRLLDSPIRAPPKRDPTMPSTSITTRKSTVADQSMGNITRRSSKPLVTPVAAKSLRARVPPPMDEKTQTVERREGEVVGEKSTRKSKSTAVISRRGRGKENNGETGRVFAFTSVDAELRDRLMEAVRKLGGSVSHSEGFDPSTTHVVCGKVIRNEKMLGAMAAALFVLKPSYVLESERQNVWIAEDEHEWCNNKQDVNGEKDLRMLEAISKWKREVAAQRSNLLVEGREGKVGAFSSWRVVLYSLTKAKIEPMMRIIRIGGGEAVLRDDVTREEIEELRPTHVLVDGAMTQANWIWNIEELRFVHSLGARAFSIEFLFKFLTSERLNEASLFLPEYKNILACG